MSIEYRTMQEIVFDSIRDGILSGRYLPGERLVADDLAKELGTSRMPIREAMHRLEVAGLVTMLPHRGASVTEISEAEIVEIYRIRAVLDGLATRLAASRLTQDDLIRLGGLIDEMSTAASQGDLQRHLRANHEFHVIVWNAAQSPRLGDLLEKLYWTSRRFRNFSIIVPGHMDQIEHSHRSILEALDKGDVVGAERLANEHHEKTVQYLLALINQGKRQASRVEPATENQ